MEGGTILGIVEKLVKDVDAHQAGIEDARTATEETVALVKDIAKGVLCMYNTDITVDIFDTLDRISGLKLHPANCECNVCVENRPEKE